MKKSMSNLSARIWVMIALTSVFGVLYSGCKKDNTEEVANGAMKMEMTDAPGDFAHVYVDVKNVEVHGNGGWISLNTRDTIYDLLSLQNDITAVLADSTVLPAGKITQMRLILGGQCSVVLTDSSEFDLIIPSSMQTGIKINLNVDIEPNKTTKVVIDFDAAQSVKDEGNGSYKMSPVIKVKSVSTL